MRTFDWLNKFFEEEQEELNDMKKKSNLSFPELQVSGQGAQSCAAGRASMSMERETVNIFII